MLGGPRRDLVENWVVCAGMKQRVERGPRWWIFLSRETGAV